MKNFSTIINDKDIITVEYQKNNSVLFSESQTLTDAQKSQARSNIGAGTSDFDGTWDSLSGKPNVVQSTGQSTSDVMSQKAVTDELNTKANSADLANYVTTDTEQDITGKKTVVPPSNKDNSNQIATTAWAGRRYKSIADFGFTSQTTVKAIVQKIIDNWYEYCTFACTNDNFNNFSDTPDGYGTLIIEVGSNALRPLISFTKQIGDSNSYKHWQANIVRGANNQVTEIQWYELALKTDIPTNYVTTDTTQNNISGRKTFTNTIVKKSTTIDLNAKPTSGTQWNYIEFTDKNNDRIGIAGSRFDAGGYAGVYLQARNSQQLWIASSTPDSNGNTVTKTSTPTPPATDDSTQIANTSWVRTNYQEKGYAGIDGAVVNSDGKVTDKDGNVVDALYFKVASLTTKKAYMRTYLLAEVAMTNIVKEQATVLIRCTTESITSAPNVTITFDNYSYESLLLPKNIFVTADYKSGTAGATFTVWVKQDKDFMQQVWNVLSQNTRNYTTTSKREWSVFYSNITKATAVTDINAAPTGYTRIVANNNNRYSNLEENTYLWQQSQNAGITWKRYSDNTPRGVFRQNDNGTIATFVTQSDGFLFRPLDNNNTKSIKVDPKTGVLYPEQNSGADLGKTAQRWNAVYAGKTGVRSTGSIICDSKVISYSAVESNKEVPDFNAILKDDLYTTAPKKTRGAQYLARDKNEAYIGGLRIYHDTDGTIQSQLLCRSQKTDVQNYVYFQAKPSAKSNAAKDTFAFIPHTNGNIDLGLSNNKWNNAYIQDVYGSTVHTSKILSSEDSKEYVACKSSGVEIGYNDRPLRLYANSRPVTAGSKIMVASDFSLSGTILTITLP